jgi:hypothetical protein
MASDGSIALANQIMSNLKGLPDRIKAAIESNPALKQMSDAAMASATADIAHAIRAYAAQEVAKATGGMSPSAPSGQSN